MRARHPSSRPKRKLNKPSVIEDLEPRRLLTTLVSGTFAANFPGDTNRLRFTDGQNNVEQITVFGNITAEVVGANVSATNQATLINLPDFRGGPLPTTPLNHTIFAIYVSQSDFTGGITVSQVAYNPTTGVFGNTEPFNGTVGILRVRGAQNPHNLITVNAPGGTGVCYLGARTIVPTPAPANPVDNEPILNILVPADAGTLFPTLPSSFIGNELTAGLIVAPGNNLGNFLFGGTVSGDVSIGGAINEFYCGWLVTGNTNGELSTNTITDPQNFTVAGNIGDLLVMGSIGVDTGAANQAPIYVSGFDMYCAGTIGLVETYNDSVYGSIDAANTTGVPTNGAAQSEIETRAGGTFDFFANDELGGSAVFNNDTFATAQYISNSYNALDGNDDSVVVNGELNDVTGVVDRVDYYAVPLMAGQTITVQVQDGTQGASSDLDDIDVGVFNPDGTEIASDYNNNTPAATEEEPFQFTADRPGVYRFAVAPTGDSQFVGNTNPPAGALPYVLTISNVGHMGIGAIVAGRNIMDNPDTAGDASFGNPGIGCQSGDLGALVAGVTVAGGTILTTGSPVTNAIDDILVENGSLRCMEGDSIGTGTAGTDPQLDVPNGSVGLLESTTGNLYCNDEFETTDPPPAIGGNYEVVSADGDLEAQLVANGNIGTIRAASIANNVGVDLPFFEVDANNLSNAGTIDLIDCTGNFGNGDGGGAPIFLGPRGQIRYMVVGGEVFNDAKFGEIIPDVNDYPAGVPAQIVESSGTVVTLTPVNTTANNVAALAITTYSLENGGQAIVNVTSSGGLSVTAAGNVAGAQAQIGTIDVGGNGNAVTAGSATVTNANGTTTTTAQELLGLKTIAVPTPPTIAATNIPVDLVFSGNTQIDAFNITGGNFDEIANNTPGGEIVTINATSIGTLTGDGAVGVNLAHNTPAAILPVTIISNTYPFNGLRTGTDVTGSIVTVSLPVIGNLIVGGSVGTLNGTVEGAVDVTGSINSVNFQTGIYPSGSGDLANAGIFAAGPIGTVSNSQPGDIRGNVISNSGILGIHVNNGSIIGATVGNPTAFFDAANINEAPFLVFDAGGSPATPILDIGSISTTGNGGIIGTSIITSNIGTVTTNGGYGIFTTNIVTHALGTVGVVTTSGYGARQFTFVGGFSFGALIAPGNGSLVSTANFSRQVQYSESAAFDPFFGTVPNELTDIDSYLGTTAATPVIPGVTDTGIVENTTLEASGNLRSVKAYEIRSTSPATEPSVFNFSNKIISIAAAGPIDGLDITTGKLTTLQTGGNLMHTSLDISGRITNLIIRANLTDSSSIVALGRNGNIGNLQVFGSMDGVIQADGGKIGNVRIYGNLFGQIKSNTINDLVLYQSLGNGSLQILGNAGTIQFIGNLGNPGDTLTVDGKLGNLIVGGNLEANVVVGKALSQLNVKGSIITGSKVTVGNVLSLMKVGADFQAGAIVQAHAVKKVKIKGVNAGSIVIV